jgi:crotonobetainyl-CoA:carnitine CoA-transferase CaiB-like acyl-CoA transferase
LATCEQLQAVDILQTLPDVDVTVVGLPMKINGVRPKSSRPAPKLGEHNGEIFEDALESISGP